MDKHIIRAIGDSLLKTGKCPYDASCPFGRGNSCIAPEDELAKKIQAIKDKTNNEPNCFATEIMLDHSPWHCENLLIVRFVDPRLCKQTTSSS
jgi:hypothetical protein